jgi:molybdopterin-guanine dinucleotide biosynthesis protein MobB
MRSGCPVIGFVGPSSAGKTTLLEGIVRSLQDRGVSVGVVKHTCHEVHPDEPGKDSARLYEAGADAVALAAPNQLVTFARREMEPRLADALIGLPPGLDVVLVEGFSWERIPRYVVLPAGLDPLPRHTARGALLGTITAPSPAGGRPPVFPPELVERLASEIATSMRTLSPGPDTETPTDAAN